MGLGDALERAGDLDAFAGLEHLGVPVGRVLEVHDLAVADDGGVLELDVLGAEHRALLRVGIGLARVRDGEHDLRVAGDGQSVLRIVAVAVRPAGLAIPLLDVDARGHVRGAGPHDVGFESLVVVVLRELILVAVGHGEALALDVGAPAGLMGVVGHEGPVAVGRFDGDDVAAVDGGRGEGEEVAAELRAVETGAGDPVALGREGLAA